MVMRTEDILGYPVVTASPEGCADSIMEKIVVARDGKAGDDEALGAAARPFWLACLNPHSGRMASSDPSAEEALKAADFLIPDGMGIVVASRILGGCIRERITGSDIFLNLSHRLNGRGASYFFLGSTEETLAVIETRLVAEFPGIRFVGAYSPPFKEVFSEEENQAMIEAVNRAAPDVLWVGMTAPKQEKWIHQNKDKLSVKFIGAVGAVFDFYAGTVKRSHPWFLEHGLEWLPRLFQEPRRLWRRTFISAPAFMWRVLKQAVTSSNRT